MAEPGKISQSEKSESPIKHTSGGIMPDATAAGETGRRVEADLPLLSDPIIQRRIAFFAGSLVLGLGAVIYLFRKTRT